MLALKDSAENNEYPQKIRTRIRENLYPRIMYPWENPWVGDTRVRILGSTSRDQQKSILGLPLQLPRYKYQYGDLEAAAKLEKRIAEAYASGASWVHLRMTNFGLSRLNS
jgi:hypothetical protein